LQEISDSLRQLLAMETCLSKFEFLMPCQNSYRQFILEPKANDVYDLKIKSLSVHVSFNVYPNDKEILLSQLLCPAFPYSL